MTVTEAIARANANAARYGEHWQVLFLLDTEQIVILPAHTGYVTRSHPHQILFDTAEDGDEEATANHG
jgi:hypothetical protein